jgi:hypothetical protein
MPETARRYGLMVSPDKDKDKDERLDPVRATRAAARYLRDLYGEFGDWKLVFAAYNAGEQAVQRARMRSGSNDLQRLAAFLPSETRAYVPAVMTARPLFGPGQAFPGPALRTARRARVLYASWRDLAAGCPTLRPVLAVGGTMIPFPNAGASEAFPRGTRSAFHHVQLLSAPSTADYR